MSTIFLSHSSKDREVAAFVRAALRDWKYQSVFLDFDPADGIPAGRNWERELYAQLRACSAVIVLCSQASMESHWCFAEITHAKALGKHVFPVTVGPCQIHGLIGEFQVVDLIADRDEGLRRLRSGLQGAGLEWRAMLPPYDPERPPYPGLQVFEQEDAAVYFGRDREVQSLLEKLETWRRLSGARLGLIVGASGSGKSSLVRAGLLPRLRLDPVRWLVLEPFRPQGQPLSQLALSLEVAFRTGGRSADWRQIHGLLNTSTASSRSKPLDDLLTDLRSAVREPAATLVLTVDQAEELFTLTPAQEREAFLNLLTGFSELPGSSALLVATLRSDFLTAWQDVPSGAKPAFEPITLEQMGAGNFREIIEQPAMLAGLELESALVEQLVQDTRTQDALPLLAFALNTLWNRYGSDRKLTFAQYQELGGLQAAIANAADAVLKSAHLSSPDLTQLRRAFSAMVRVNDEDQYVRRPVKWKDLPSAIHPLIERFVREHLLVSRGGADGETTVEVAHEALFRGWSTLNGWLNEDREFFLWRRRLEGAVVAWSGRGKDPDTLWRGAALASAEAYLRERPEFLNTEERAFIQQGLSAQRLEQEGAKRRRFRIMAGLAAGLVLAIALSAFAGYQWFVAEEERARAEQQRTRAEQQSREVLARQLARDAELAMSASADSLTLSTLLSVESLNASWTVDAYQTLLQRLDLLPPRAIKTWKAHQGPISAVAVSNDGKWLASTDGHDVAVWDLEQGTELRRLTSENGALSPHAVLAFSPGRDVLAAGCRRKVCAWSTSDWREQPTPPLPEADEVWSLAYSPDGALLAVAGYHAPNVVLYQVADWRERGRTPHTPAGSVFGVAFSPRNGLFATASGGGLKLWELTVGGPRPLPNGLISFPIRAEAAKAELRSLAFNSDGKRLAVTGNSAVTLWNLGTGAQLQEEATFAYPGGGRWSRPAFSRDGRYLVVGPSVRVWDLSAGTESMRFGAGEDVATVSRAGLVYSARNNTVIARALEGPRRELARLEHGAPVNEVQFSADGRRIVTASTAGVRVFDVDVWREVFSLPVADGAAGAALSRDAQMAVAWSGNVVLLLDASTGKINSRREYPVPVSAALFSPTSAQLAVVADSVELSKPTSADARLRLEHPISPTRIAFSPDGKWLTTFTPSSCKVHVGVTRYSMTYIWNAATGERAAWQSHEERDTKSCMGLRTQLDPEAPKPGREGDPALLDVSEQWLSTAKREEEITSRDGRWRASRSRADTELTEVKSERTLNVVRHDQGIVDAAFSPDSRWLVTASEDRTARVWALTAKDLVAEACSRLGRNLTSEEWARYRGNTPYAKTCKELPIDTSSP